VLTRNPTTGRWSVGPAILVADDDDPFNETDQFLPRVDVAPNGNVHIIYYDDREYPQADDDPTPRFDVFYAWASGSQLNFQDPGHTFELCDDPQNNCLATVPAVDFALPAMAFVFGDYIGIDVGAGRVWTSFMGHAPYPRDPYENKSVIWSSQILLP